MSKNRCSICDFHEGGLCSNYETDYKLDNGVLNKVTWSKTHKAFVCWKCFSAIDLIAEEYRDEKEGREGYVDTILGPHHRLDDTIPEEVENLNDEEIIELAEQY